MDALSKDMRVYLLSFLPPKTLCALSETSHKFHAAADREWERRVREEFVVEKHPNFDQERSWGEIWWEHANSHENYNSFDEQLVLSALRPLVRLGLPFNSEEELGYLSFLCAACEMNWPDAVEFALEHGAPLDDYDCPLEAALEKSTQRIIDSICKYATKDTLQAAVYFDCFESFKRLINMAEPYMIFDVADHDVKFAKLLVEYGVGVNTTDDDGVPVICYAILNNNVKLAEYLLERGANGNVMFAYSQNTLLETARDRGMDEMVEVLLKYKIG